MTSGVSETMLPLVLSMREKHAKAVRMSTTGRPMTGSTPLMTAF
jgi:hypothetical protein